MAAWTYVAADREASTSRGRVEAESEAAAVAALRARGLVVVELRAEAGPGARAARWPATWLRVRGLDIELGLRQLAFMLRSGLPLLTALRTTSANAPRPRVASLFRRVGDRVQEGAGLSSALGDERRVDPVVTALVSVGEQTGELDRVLGRAADDLERRREARAQVLTALTYPTIVLVLAVGVVAYLLVALVPRLRKFLAGLGRRLPELTQAIVDASAWVTEHGLLLATSMLGAVAAWVAVRAWSPGRLATDRLLLRLPVVGRALRLAGTAGFARTLGTLLESGVRLTEALRVAAPLHGNRELSGRVLSAREHVMAGGTLAEPLGRPGGFLPLLSSMVAVGESSGSLATVLGEVATFHESRLAAFVRRASALFEPVVILVVGSVVGVVYLAFFMAIYAVAGGR